MIELTAWPPSAGRPSMRTTLRPSFAASIAAETPAMPAPTTQMSASTSRSGPWLVRRTMRVPAETPEALVISSPPIGVVRGASLRRRHPRLDRSRCSLASKDFGVHAANDQNADHEYGRTDRENRVNVAHRQVGRKNEPRKVRPRDRSD